VVQLYQYDYMNQNFLRHLVGSSSSTVLLCNPECAVKCELEVDYVLRNFLSGNEFELPRLPINDYSIFFEVVYYIRYENCTRYSFKHRNSFRSLLKIQNV